MLSRLTANIPLLLRPTMSNEKKQRKWFRRIIIWSSVLVIFLCLVGLALPYALKRYIENHSVEWIDRKVTIDRLVLNPFTFRYAVNGVTITERNKKEVFVSWRSISLRADLWNAFQQDDWQFRQLRIEDPYLHITQQGERFNFTDLMELGGEEGSVDTTSSSTLFSMRDVHIHGGQIDYSSDILLSPVQIEELEAHCTEISSVKTQMDFGLGFSISSGGRMDGDFTIDTETNGYGIHTQLKEFNIAALKPYLSEFFSCDAFEGLVDIDLHLSDNLDDTTSLAMSSAMHLNKVNLTDPNGDPLISWKNASIKLDTLVAKDKLLEMGEVNVDQASLRFVLLDEETDNWTRLIKLDSTVVEGDSTASITASESNVFLMLTDYIGSLAEQMITKKYSAKKISITNATVQFEDHIPPHPLRYTISDLGLSTQRVTTDQETGTISGTATLQETGKLDAKLTFDPNNIQNMHIALNTAQFDLNHVDAYGRWYAAHPLEDGLLDLVSRTSITDGKIDSQNAIHVDRLSIGKKVKEHDPETIVLPLRLAAGLLKDADGVVELDIPVTGDLNDPKFKPWPIVWKIFKDLIIKAATAPGNLLANSVKGSDPEDLERVRFTYLQRSANKTQQKALGELAKALNNKPGLTVDLISIVDMDIETQEMGVFQTKRLYLFPEKAVLETADSLKIAALHVQDSLFTAFIQERTPTLNGRSIHERCTAIAGAEYCKTSVDELEASRRASVSHTLQTAGLAIDRVKFREGTEEELTGQRGVPGYRFIYAIGEEGQ